MLVEQDVRDPLALGGIADHDRHDMARIVHVRDAVLVEQCAQAPDAVLMAGAFEGADLQVADRGNGAGSERWRQRRREDEAGSKGADEIAQRRGGRNVTAHDAERLAERALDHRQAIHQAFALGNAAATRAIHADGMDFIEIGHRPVLVGEIADLLDRRDVTIHRIDRFEGDHFWRVRIGGRQFGFEVVEIVVLPDDAVALGITDAFDHRGMVQRVGEDDHARDLLAERAQRRPVGDITGGEDQGCFLAVQVGKLALEQDMVVTGARDIPGASRTRATVVDGVFHRLDHLGMLAHAEIIIGTPNRHVFLFAAGMARCARKIAAMPLEIGEHAVTAFLVKFVQLAFEKRFEIHVSAPQL